ncbi:MAG TPA: hypothetical protein VLA19_09420 [Herpetosiphonaceae bacterium]|nr:hypothetical protein [Herpetosiphonaceae bacterium]
MFTRFLLGSTMALVLAGPALAGPCTQQITDLGKAITAKHEGAGPALANAPAPTGSAGQSSSSTAVKAEATGDNQAMQLLQQAKELDQQGKEDECMQVLKSIQGMAPAGIK